MLSLIENMTKHIIVMRDSFYNECLVFLNQCECKSNIFLHLRYLYGQADITMLLMSFAEQYLY